MERPTRAISDLDAVTAALADRARRDAGGGPPAEPEELLDYLAGRLAPEAEERVRRRLVADPGAARALLDLAALEAAGRTGADAEPAAPDARHPPAPPADFALRAGWRDLQRRLRPADRRRRPAGLVPALSALAAALLIAAVGLGVRVARLESERDRPIGNLASLELAAATRADREPTVELAPGEPVRLVLAPAERCDDYAAALTGPTPGDRRTIAGLERDQLGLVTLLLRPQPGSYSLRLLGCQPRRELESYGFRIVRPAGGPGG